MLAAAVASLTDKVRAYHQAASCVEYHFCLLYVTVGKAKRTDMVVLLLAFGAKIPPKDG
jgi:hypothetical protein